MNGLTTYQPPELPDTIEDLGRFVLVGREKLTAVRAAIRAIDRVQLAQEVRDQKMEEARMLSEALLDAEVRLGEMTKAIPRAPGARTDIQPTDTAVGRLATGEVVSDSSITNQKPKSAVIQSLGFTPKQVERFETLADNKDLVEQVKRDARENDDIPTRTQVLNLASYRKKQQEQEARQIDDDARRHKAFIAMVSGILNFITSEQELEALTDAVTRSCKGALLDSNLTDLDRAIGLLTSIKTRLIEKGANHGKK